MIPLPDFADAPGADILFGPWSFCASSPGAIDHPDQIRQSGLTWQPALVPGTVASSLQALGQWDLSQPLDADAKDWWYRTAFDLNSDERSANAALCFDGLATLAEVWLNGTKILTTDNMFRSHRVNVAQYLRDHNELAIGFRSLTTFLETRRARPRWKTNLVKHQQMRWCRTSLLGRIPGWTPPVTPAGPWRAIRLERGPIVVSDVHVTSVLEGDVGVVSVHAVVQSDTSLECASLQVGEAVVPLEIQAADHGRHLVGAMQVANPPLWWPHTHGAQPLLDAVLSIDTNGARLRHPCGKIGFRRLEVDRQIGFGVKVNGVPIFCRGACWTVADIVTLDGSPEQLSHDLHHARAAGVNMLRVGGTMIYESDHFYDLCDQLGILVWQDFMFANMDYPVEDAAFAANIVEEGRQQLRRLARHPAVAVYCGNSEVEQQASMLGMPRELWRNGFFAERLPALCAADHPAAEYLPSTPSGGTLPFHVASGVTHYYGVGAYLRPVSDVRRANVKFTSECLGFANVPEPETVNHVVGGGPVMLHHPRWKQRVPRDTGAGWDFEDVRDHYLKQLFGVDPVHLRSFDPDRYLRLSRVVTGEVMAQVFAEWRSGHSNNRGALVWFFKDLWPGAGWGIVDSLGIPKAAYYFLKRSWQSHQVLLTDEGLDGLHIHVINESAMAWNGFVEIMLLRDDHVVVARAETSCELRPHSQITVESDALLGGFYDVCHAYRFGPPKHEVAIATLYDAERRVISEAFHFVQAREPSMLAAVEIQADAEPSGEGGWEVTLQSNRFLRGVALDAKGLLPDDNYFNLAPMRPRKISLRALARGAVKLAAYVEALNLRDPVRIAVRKP